MLPNELPHEELLVRRGRRSGITIAVAVHSTALGPALGGCRIWRYPSWTDGVADALRLAEAMTAKAAIAGLAHGGGKTVAALPPGTVLDVDGRRALLLDIGDAVDALGGRYWTGPDVGTGPADMAVVGERTERVFCRPEADGGTGDSSPATADGVLAALEVLGRRLDADRGLAGLRVAMSGLGHVGTLVARRLAAAGARLVVSDIDPTRRAVAQECGADWADPEEVLVADVDVLVPAALGGQLTPELVDRLRCRAVAGPANNQLAADAVADLLHARGIVWAPDYLVSAGGVVGTTAREIDGLGPHEARARVRGIGETLDALLDEAAERGESPHRTAQRRITERLSAVPA
ncbi:Glu/Leu/Phe/Val dehydrogenase dimerization domain-containing protein [Pseudonocardia sp. CA-107938]|uniref:Glu/Leu/Phe/Val dehydrogenase dimerization domain-containing protein n=1 Tax=Pseudonocardia sp. CA-107938 TaxID=3240021 RepID=UPI003D900EAE